MSAETGSSARARNKNIARSAFKVSLGSLLTLLTGFASQVVIAWFFGVGVEMDAFFTAMVVPLYLELVLLGGLSFVFIPAFVRYEIEGKEEDAWSLVGTFFWLVAAVLTVVGIGGSIFAHDIIDLSAPGLDADKAALAATMLSILMFSVPLSGLASMTQGVANARNSYFLPAVSPAVGALGNVLVMLLFSNMLGPLVLPCGLVVSVALRWGLNVTPVLRRGWNKLLPLHDERVRELARLMWPFILFNILTRCTPLLERYFASGLPDGDLSYLGYATKVTTIIMNVMGNAIGVAILPTMARAYAESGDEGLSRQTEYAFRLSAAVGLPAVLLLSATSVPLISVMFERGAFLPADTLSVSRIIPIMLLGSVFFRMLGNVAARTLYVTKDTLTGPLSAAATAVLYVFMAGFLVEQWGYIGLAWAQPIQLGLALIVVWVVMFRRLPFFSVGRLCKDGLRYTAASLIAAGLAWLAVAVLASFPALLQLSAAWTLSGLAYLLMLFWLDREITIAILEMAGIPMLVAKLKTINIRKYYPVNATRSIDR